MDKKQQIEEIANITYDKIKKTFGAKFKDIAEAIYSAGYRKIDENCAVITKSELKEYKRQAVKEFAEKMKEKCSDYLYDTNFDGKNNFDIPIGEILRMIEELLKEYEE